MAIIEDTGLSLSLAVIILGLALGLPSLDFGMFGFDFSKMSPVVISILRLGLIGLALTIGLKPIENDSQSGWT